MFNYKVSYKGNDNKYCNLKQKLLNKTGIVIIILDQLHEEKRKNTLKLQRKGRTHQEMLCPFEIQPQLIFNKSNPFLLFCSLIFKKQLVSTFF